MITRIVGIRKDNSKIPIALENDDVVYGHTYIKLLDEIPLECNNNNDNEVVKVEGKGGYIKERGVSGYIQDFILINSSIDVLVSKNLELTYSGMTYVFISLLVLILRMCITYVIASLYHCYYIKTHNVHSQLLCHECHVRLCKKNKFQRWLTWKKVLVLPLITRKG